MERRNLELERRVKDLEKELEDHRRDDYAHAPMIGRIMRENLSLRENILDRLRSLERFRAQAIVLGGIALTILGATSYGVAAKVFGF